jgi:hypothetical protein
LSLESRKEHYLNKENIPPSDYKKPKMAAELCDSTTNLMDEWFW